MWHLEGLVPLSDTASRDCLRRLSNAVGDLVTAAEQWAVRRRDESIVRFVQTGDVLDWMDDENWALGPT
jgi:hypothetical protein